MAYSCRALAVITVAHGAAAVSTREKERERTLASSWDQALNSGKADDTPVTRVVGLLKEMQLTMGKEQEEDEAQYHELACWCNNGSYEKGEAAEASGAKISELRSTIEGLTAKSADLSTRIKELNSQVASDKDALAQATNERKQQSEDFHASEMDSIQGLENMKAALTVLGHAPSLVQLPWAQDAVDQLPFSFIQRRSDDLESTDAQDMQLSSSRPAGLSASDEEVVKKALSSASAFLQARQVAGEKVAQPGTNEIVGVMKQVQEEMQASLKEAQELERTRAAEFAELRSSKEEQIEEGHRMSETKEDELARTNNDNAEAKEDLAQEQASLKETEAFIANLKKTCAEADSNFNQRKLARVSEIKAVGETIEILTGDEARDAMAGTYSFAQLASTRRAGARTQTRTQTHMQRMRRMAAARVLRRAALASGDEQLSLLASTVELDAFTEVKKAIDDLIAALKTQQEEEVKKNDWCGMEIQETTMTSGKTEESKTDLETRAAELEESIKASEAAVVEAKTQIAQAEVDLQRATNDRVAANLEFQKTVSDQTLTIDILKKALDKLANFYDASLVQTGARSSGGLRLKQAQTPPVAQAEYKPSGGAAGVMSMIEKLIQEAKELVAESKKGEMQSQQAYEQTVADTNNQVAALQAEVVSRSKAVSQGQKDKLQTESDIADTARELDGLSKYMADLHRECDYLMKNFNARQQARAAEVESLQQADQILSGASSS